MADPEKMRVIAGVSREICGVFPYLNAIEKGCICDHPALTITIKKDEKLFALHAHYIPLAKIEDKNLVSSGGEKN